MPSSRFRILQNITEIEKYHYDITIKKIPKNSYNRLSLFSTLSSYDIVFLQKKLFQWWFLWLIKKKSKLLIYEFDDAVLYRDSDYNNFNSYTRNHRFKNTLKFADKVIAGNEYLRDIGASFSTNIHVIPTGINTQIYVPRRKQIQAVPYTIGWIGSKSNLPLLKQIIEPLNKLYIDTKTFRLKVVCDDFNIDSANFPIDFKRWRESEEVSDIQSFDIGVMPFVNNKWTKGKCALKLLQYMSCQLPSVSSKSDVTSSLVINGKNGYLASNALEWYDCIKILLDHPNQFEVLGKEARKSIIGRFDTETIARQYVKIFDDMIRCQK